MSHTQEAFIVGVSLSPEEVGLYSSIRQAKGLSNDQMISEMTAFCLRLLLPELAVLSPQDPFAEDLERAVGSTSDSLRRLSNLLSGAEKVLLDAAALREHMSHNLPREP